MTNIITSIASVKSTSVPVDLHAVLAQMDSVADSVRICHTEVTNGTDLTVNKTASALCGKALTQIQVDLSGVRDNKIKRKLEILQLDYDCLVDRINCAAVKQIHRSLNRVNVNLRLSLEYTPHKTYTLEQRQQKAQKIGNRLLQIAQQLRDVDEESLKKKFGLLLYRYNALAPRMLIIDPSAYPPLCSPCKITPSHETGEYELAVIVNEDLPTPALKTAFLQVSLEEYCDKGNLEGVEWAIKIHKESELPPLQLLRPLELAILGGYSEVVQVLCRWIDPAALRKDEKGSLNRRCNETGKLLEVVPYLKYGIPKSLLVTLCVEMGYPHLLPILEQYGFPILDAQRREMRELSSMQEELAPFHPLS